MNEAHSKTAHPHRSEVAVFSFRPYVICASLLRHSTYQTTTCRVLDFFQSFKLGGDHEARAGHCHSDARSQRLRRSNRKERPQRVGRPTTVGAPSNDLSLRAWPISPLPTLNPPVAPQGGVETPLWMLYPRETIFGVGFNGQ